MEEKAGAFIPGANSEAGDAHPMLAKAAAEIATGHGLSCTVFDKAGLRELGMNSLLGVASGSNEEPRFTILEYAGGRTDAAPFVLVGKGVTFDSGGINVKTGSGMQDMKMDMAGAAIVLSVFSVIS